MRGVAHEWFKCYLTDRCQFTADDNANSSALKITCGIPQGSVLDPLLLLIYINDIINSVPDKDLKLFADDTNLFVTGATFEAANKSANEAVANLHKWFTANKLTLNIDKTCYMAFPPVKADSIALTINGVNISKVKSCKYLGVVIDEDLKWTEHIQTVYQKLVRYTSIFYKLRHKIPQTVLTNIYFAFVHPHILYGIEIYANTCPTFLEKLIRLNNKLLRTLQNKPLRHPLSELYCQYNTMPINMLHQYQLMLLVHKCQHHVEKMPDVFRNYFELNSSIHTHNTRTKNSIHLFRSKTTFGQRCFKYRTSNFWNDLPADCKEESCTNTFKSKLKDYLLAR